MSASHQAARQVVIREYGGPSNIAVQRHELSPLKEGHARITVEASTVTTTDTVIRRGFYPLIRDKPPHGLGYDFVGKIAELGSGNGTFSVGDRVAGIVQIGGNADVIDVAVSDLLSAPDDVDPQLIAPLVLSGMTGYQILNHVAKLESGDSFLVHGGSGSVGTTLLQLCRSKGIRTVTTASPSKHEAVSFLADVVIDYKSQDCLGQLQVAAGDGFDAVLDFTNQKSFNRSFKLLGKGGTLVAAGTQTLSKTSDKKTMAGFIRFSLDFAWLLIKLHTWRLMPNAKNTAFFGIVNSLRDERARFQSDFDELCDLVRTGELTPVADGVFGLDDVAEAHERLESGLVTGTIVINPKKGTLK